ncbi:DNA repair protein endonuclease SAE2/CtIP C-terminus-domain-containing protein, partial [Lobosporangium transversale]
RRKDKRKQMHGHDCACCRRFYELTGPLPLPDGYNTFFTPAPRPGEKEVWEKTAEERLQDRIQQISRHRVHHESPMTPPGFWDTDFPLTPDRLEWDRIADERRDRKKQRM